MIQFNPQSTYRLQFNKNFTLKQAHHLLPYLHKLGIKSIYASPIFEATKGSLHGYDVTNPLAINPEIGSQEDFKGLIKDLHQLKMGWIQDIVPNHMAYAPENPWIYDVLEKGPYSDYYHFFDINHNHPDPELKNKLLLPFFGEPVNELIEKKVIQVIIRSTGLKLKYYDNEYPVSIPVYTDILNSLDTSPLPASIITFLGDAKSPDNWEKIAVRFYELYKSDAKTRKHIESCLSITNSDTGKMQSLINKLFYLPAHWKETSKSINYRRFFTINSLICLNMQNKEVFDIYHKLILKWVSKGWIDGIRVDHVDGLYEPSQYLSNLMKQCGDKTYYCIEKILGENESLPPQWSVQGTTGYDFLAAVNNLLTNTKNSGLILNYYKSLSNKKLNFQRTIHQSKRFILYNHLNGELDRLTQEYLEIQQNCIAGLSDSTKPGKHSEKLFRKAIGEFLVYFPIYKIYHSPSDFTLAEKKLLQRSIHEAAAEKTNADITMVLSGLQNILFLKDCTSGNNPQKINHFFRLSMQYTGTLMAKGLEDTAFYSYIPFLAHNEVGDSPGCFGISTAKFHAKMIHRQANFPLTMNCTSTHDTKRGEDARARLNVLGDVPDKWISISKKWRRLNASLKQRKDNKEIPTPNDEYLIYQSLCGHLPMNAGCEKSFVKRFEDYMIKALREAKENTSWNNPDKEYEDRIIDFIRKILSSGHHFKESYLSFMSEIIPHGIINSITQTVLKYLAPGVPDTYQGAEDYDLSFVDPDNRRAVNYKKHSKQLDEILDEYHTNASSLLEKLWRDAENGKIKHLISHVCLQMRKENENLFLKGSYEPLKVKGKYKNHIIAFYRRYHDEHLLIILPLNTAALPKNIKWGNTRVKLPDFVPPTWENKLSKEILDVSGAITISGVFKTAPFGILKGVPAQPERRSGILMHISSLPGPYGIGDFGKEAYQFIDFLNRTGQQYWQILPLNISDKHTQYSPYSSFSAFAFNTLFIDPDNLVESGLIKKTDLENCKQNASDTVDYEWAEKNKRILADKAYKSFQQKGSSGLRNSYQIYLQKENDWLDDFALFSVMKQSLNNKSWNEWPVHYRDRDETALRKFAAAHEKDIDKCKFVQFLLNKQWNQLKEYANEKNIKIFGDIPFYVSFDSVDVWTNTGLFKLNPDKSMESVSGVPPDYFNANGQLWGMPIYDWDKMEQDDYKWWISRLQKNLEWFDLLRLDHFRGFSAYWEVPASHETAMNGQWLKGPGTGLFDAIQRKFPQMPFVAEDLGQIDQPVYDLRDTYNLPGMKVLQFGFGTNMPFLQHVPNNHTYNSIVYTCTHDNNTMKGWYRKESDKATRKRFKKYTGMKLKENNCHLKFIRLTYSSVSKIAVIPMQDWLGLDENHRMNFPSTTEGNWLWRLTKEQITGKIENKIRKMIKLFGRY